MQMDPVWPEGFYDVNKTGPENRNAVLIHLILLIYLLGPGIYYCRYYRRFIYVY